MADSTDPTIAHRECLAAIAMAYAPATDIPRERALIQSAVNSLVAAFGENSFTKDAAIAEITRHGQLPELRPQIADDLFTELLRSGTICTIPDTGTYSLSPDFVRQAEESSTRIDGLIDAVTRDLFSDLALPQPAQQQLRDHLLLCLANTMSAFGRQYVYQSLHRTDDVTTIDRGELVALCRRTTLKKQIHGVPPEKLADAITELFACKDPTFAKLVFHLAQNYYYLRLLGLAGGLDTIAAEQYRDAELLLDTNIAIPFVFPESHHHRSVLELSELALQLNIVLRVTEATLDEYHAVLDNIRTTMVKAFDEVPDDLVEKTHSVYLRAYRDRKAKNPGLTVVDFFQDIIDLRSRLGNEWGITVFDETLESVSVQDLAKAKEILQKCSVAVRRRKKGDATLDHDAHLYFLVMAERQQNGKSWLLTRDTSLPAAALELQGATERSFCMTLDGFLQIMSPYVRADHRQSFAELFVELISRNLFPPEEVIELEDFRMFTDFDLSIRKLPGEDVQRVIRRVKHTLGGNFHDVERRKVAYEVQKAISDPTLSYRTTLEREAKALRDALDDTKRIIADKERNISDQESRLASQEERHQSDISALTAEMRSAVGRLEEQVRRTTQQVDTTESAKAALAERHDTLLFWFRFVVATIVAIPLGMLPWWIPDTWLSMLSYPVILRGAISASVAGLWITVVTRQAFAVIASISIGILAAGLALAKLMK